VWFCRSIRSVYLFHLACSMSLSPLCLSGVGRNLETLHPCTILRNQSARPARQDHHLEAVSQQSVSAAHTDRSEAALFSNISATALMQLKSTPDPDASTLVNDTSTTPAANSSHRDETHSTTDNEDTTPDLPSLELWRLLAQIGLDASEVCISLAGYITVGSMSKSCKSCSTGSDVGMPRRAQCHGRIRLTTGRRAGEFCEKSKDRYIPPDKIRFFKEQEELLKGLDEKGMFADVPRERVAKPARV